jgi:hypothetical protein
LCFLLCFSFLCFVLLDLWLFGSFILPALSPTAAAAASPRRTHHGPMQKNVPMNGKLTVYITNLRNKTARLLRRVTVCLGTLRLPVLIMYSCDSGKFLIEPETDQNRFKHLCNRSAGRNMLWPELLRDTGTTRANPAAIADLNFKVPVS